MRSPNIPYAERLDHLRFFAVLAVISFHVFHPIYKKLAAVASAYEAPVNALSVFIMEGNTGVGLFFTLSGFLFARICLHNQFDIRQFYLNRLLRIYPLFLSTLVLSICVNPAPIDAFFTSLLSFNTLPTAVKNNFVDHLWSVGVEIQFYALFPVLLLSYRKSGLKYLLQVLILDVLIIAGLYFATGSTRDMVYATILGRLNQLVIGMIFGFSFDRIRKFASNILVLPAALLAMSFALQWFHACGGLPGTGRNSLWIFWPSLEALLWGGVICSYQACNAKIPNILSRPLAYLGAMSYSLYVTHYFIACTLWPMFVSLLQAPHSRYKFLLPLQDLLLKHPLETSLWAGTFLILPPTLLLSVLTFNVIEKPFMNIRRKYAFPVEVSLADVEHEDKKLASQH